MLSGSQALQGGLIIQRYKCRNSRIMIKQAVISSIKGRSLYKANLNPSPNIFGTPLKEEARWLTFLFASRPCSPKRTPSACQKRGKTDNVVEVSTSCEIFRKNPYLISHVQEQKLDQSRPHTCSTMKRRRCQFSNIAILRDQLQTPSRRQNQT